MKQAYTVAQITKYIKDMFKQDFVLQSVKVTGEISNCKYHQIGHVYFKLKDDKSTISCVMFASDAAKMSFRLKDGQKVEIEGRIEVFERDGVYQLYARKIKQDGEGALYERYLELKNRLEEMGMFASEYKRSIPKYISTLGVVTAPTGAAVRDIIQIATRRNPYVQIVLYPALVQGEGAAASIVQGIHTLEKAGVDTIIVGRGGGSIEDLWAFNEEIVATAIFESVVPIISAVGHETDFTIADFVADLRAPTPSAAAELAVYEVARVYESLDRYKELLNSSLYDVVRNYRQKAELIRAKLLYLSPKNQLDQKKTYSMNLEERLSAGMDGVLMRKKHDLSMYAMQMKGLSPLEKLSQGYSVASMEGGKRVHSVKDVSPGDNVRLYVSDGYVKTKVEEIYEQG